MLPQELAFIHISFVLSKCITTYRQASDTKTKYFFTYYPKLMASAHADHRNAFLRLRADWLEGSGACSRQSEQKPARHIKSGQFQRCIHKFITEIRTVFTHEQKWGIIQFSLFSRPLWNLLSTCPTFFHPFLLTDARHTSLQMLSPSPVSSSPCNKQLKGC